MTTNSQSNIALLIDCENASPKSIHGILSELAERGTVNIRRACAAQLAARRKSKKKLRGDTELMNALSEAISRTAEDDGWPPAQKIGTYVTNQSSLSSKNYGYAKWTDLIRATEYFDTELREGKHPFFREKAGTKN